MSNTKVYLIFSSTIILVLIGGFFLCKVVIFPWISHIHIPQCVKTHKEMQTKMPYYYTPKGGGIAIPLGNVKQVEVEVCDEYK